MSKPRLESKRRVQIQVGTRSGKPRIRGSFYAFGRIRGAKKPRIKDLEAFDLPSQNDETDLVKKKPLLTLRQTWYGSSSLLSTVSGNATSMSRKTRWRDLYFEVFRGLLCLGITRW